MKRKHIAISLLLALAANLTTAAAPDSERAASPDKPYNLHHLYRPDNLHTLSSAAPKPDNMDAPPVLQPQPASVYDAATAAKTDITYTPYHPAKDIPANNGHRKILGETADGRLVIQDYYQNSDRPRTAPYILNRYGDPQILTINADSKLVWYNQDGSVYAIQHYHDGQPAGYLSYYRTKTPSRQRPRFLRHRRQSHRRHALLLRRRPHPRPRIPIWAHWPLLQHLTLPGRRKPLRPGRHPAPRLE